VNYVNYSQNNVTIPGKEKHTFVTEIIKLIYLELKSMNIIPGKKHKSNKLIAIVDLLIIKIN